MTHRYTVGTRIEYRPAFGTADPIIVTIAGLGEKNDQPVYDLDNGHWTYEHQIVRKVS
jgi:hypothetical protein